VNAVAERERRYVGLATRAIAFAIDALLIDVVAVVVAALAALGLSLLSVDDSLDGALVAIAGVLFVIWSVAYFVTFWSTTGQTPGSRVMGARVCRAADGATLRPRVAAARVVCLVLAALPACAGFLPILIDPRRRGLHDMLAGTVVVDPAERVDTPAWPPRTALETPRPALGPGFARGPERERQ